MRRVEQSTANQRSGSREPSGGLAKVDLAALAIGQVAPVRPGREAGHLREARHRPEISFVEPPPSCPPLMSGDADFIWSNPPALLAARANNVPIKSVTTVSVAGDDPSTFPIQVMVPAGSDIKTLADLAGKKVATASLFQLNDLALMESLTKAGVDATERRVRRDPLPQHGRGPRRRSRRRHHLHGALRHHHQEQPVRQSRSCRSPRARRRRRRSRLLARLGAVHRRQP